MSDPLFPSGPWIGFYTYPEQRSRYLMDLLLEFRDGVLSGEGADGIGPFGICGRYHVSLGECSWTKTYFGSHAIAYVGYREQKGIWGTWTNEETTGGFHIWPLGGTAMAMHHRVEVEARPRVAPLPLTPAGTPFAVGTGRGSPSAAGGRGLHGSR